MINKNETKRNNQNDKDIIASSIEEYNFVEVCIDKSDNQASSLINMDSYEHTNYIDDLLQSHPKMSSNKIEAQQ